MTNTCSVAFSSHISMAFSHWISVFLRFCSFLRVTCMDKLHSLLISCDRKTSMVFGWFISLQLFKASGDQIFAMWLARICMWLRPGVFNLRCHKQWHFMWSCFCRYQYQPYPMTYKEVNNGLCNYILVGSRSEFRKTNMKSPRCKFHHFEYSSEYSVNIWKLWHNNSG